MLPARISAIAAADRGDHVARVVGERASASGLAGRRGRLTYGPRAVSGGRAARISASPTLSAVDSRVKPRGAALGAAACSGSCARTPFRKSSSRDAELLAEVVALRRGCGRGAAAARGRSRARPRPAMATAGKVGMSPQALRISSSGFTSGRSRLLNCTTFGICVEVDAVRLAGSPPCRARSRRSRCAEARCESATKATASAPASTTLRVDLCITCPGTVKSFSLTAKPLGGAELDRQEVEVERAVVLWCRA